MLIYTPYDKFALAIRDVVNYPCPVSTLPTELLQEIFAFSMTCRPRPMITDGIPDEELKPTGFQATALMLTWVCSQWRQIALSMPELWGTMTIYKPKKYSVELVKIYLSRSGDFTPLDLSLCQGPVLDNRAVRFPELFPEHEATVEILKLWVPLAARWRCINLDMSFTPPFHELPNILPDALCSVQWARLHFRRQPYPSDGVVDWLWGNIFRSPALRFADWRDLRRNLVNELPLAPFAQLHEFFLNHPTSTTLLSVLPLCGQLRRLHVSNFGAKCSRPSPASPSAITLPYLEFLQLDVGEELPNVLDYITTPALQELGMSETSKVPFADVHTLERFLERSGCSLRRLTLREQEGDETRTLEYLCHAYKYLASLQSLSLSWDRISERVISLLTPSTDDVPFSSLLALELRDTDTRDGIISSMVELRSCRGAPLRHFYCTVNWKPMNASGYLKDKAAFEELRHEGLQLSWFVRNADLGV